MDWSLQSPKMVSQAVDSVCKLKPIVECQTPALIMSEGAMLSGCRALGLREHQEMAVGSSDSIFSSCVVMQNFLPGVASQCC